mmetsp:Transcript_10149/g.14900  ORF Transcript_10149/g.14900 Transcript_10149/m.14900 type:complete len:89 (+) Transcript_10149:410-676(+)
MKEAESKHRNQLAPTSFNEALPLESMKAELEQHILEADFFLEESLPRWISMSTDKLKLKANAVHCENQKLSKLMIGYKKRLSERTSSK